MGLLAGSPWLGAFLLVVPSSQHPQYQRQYGQIQSPYWPWSWPAQQSATPQVTQQEQQDENPAAVRDRTLEKGLEAILDPDDPSLERYRDRLWHEERRLRSSGTKGHPQLADDLAEVLQSGKLTEAARQRLRAHYVKVSSGASELGPNDVDSTSHYTYKTGDYSGRKYIKFQPDKEDRECCFGFNHLAANFQCELRWAMYLNRTLVVNDFCESPKHDGKRHPGDQMRWWSEFYDLHKISKVVSVTQDQAAVKKQLQEQDQLQHIKASMSTNQTEVVELLNRRSPIHNAPMILVQNPGPFCNWYFECEVPLDLNNKRFEATTGPFIQPVLDFSPRLHALADPVIARLGQYNSMHVRRSDKITDPNLPASLRVHDIGPEKVLQTAGNFFPDKSVPIYVASDEVANSTYDFFNPLKQNFKVYRASDFPEFGNLSAHELMAVEMMVLAKSVRFVMSDRSHVSRNVQVMRHHMTLAESERGIYRHLQGTVTEVDPTDTCPGCVWHEEVKVIRGDEQRERLNRMGFMNFISTPNSMANLDHSTLPSWGE